MMVSAFLLVLLAVAVLSVPVAQAYRPDDCDDLYRDGYTHSGIYTIYPTVSNTAVQVFCDMDFKDKAGWTVSNITCQINSPAEFSPVTFFHSS
ncbi:hypothetical protein SKAU_G00116030 [Synaphobranchus kaupii]|uniref:Fibrinogen C-terminal domain-containing protein n=1 Tax=Synaphobranchus kaupii TaxID=118154 RepID=A0A9Q1FNE9_SYNKA|nr:hypothetical protein SKAU_G00116030 [Synaphobranchus kaupii]